VRDVAATYIALGLDTSRAVFFRQSDIPEVTELTWLLSTVSGMGLLERAHSYKDKVARGLPSSVGLFTYPILQTADIVIYDSDVVPVGQDQVQHIEMAADMAGHFNAAYGGEFLKKPTWALSPTPKVTGTDGAKMSKSYGNSIGLFDEGKALKAAVNKIVTDSRSPEEPKEPDSVNAFALLALFLGADEKADWERRLRAGGVGYGHLKGALIEQMDACFGEARGAYRELMGSDAGARRIDDVLAEGASIARPIARGVLARCLDAVGMRQAAAARRA
jgi:tryptophanyl-tRNA synthetase